MKKTLTRKIIYFIFFLPALFNPFSFALSEILKKDSVNRDLPYKGKKVSISKEHSSSNPIFEKNFLNFFEKNTKLVLNDTINNQRELEIKSDEQYKEKDVIYAKGNVLVTFKGNRLKADSIVYDKLNEKFDAFGNIKLILGKQISSIFVVSFLIATK